MRFSRVDHSKSSSAAHLPMCDVSLRAQHHDGGGGSARLNSNVEYGASGHRTNMGAKMFHEHNVMEHRPAPGSILS